MRWKGRRISTNVEDRRGGGRVKAGGFSILGVVVAFVAWRFFGIDPQQAYRATQAVTSSQSAQEGSAPKQMTAEELEAALKEIITETGATSGKDMGKVMGVASKKLAGLAEGRAISAKVKELLG